jgi:hypothetical protein
MYLLESECYPFNPAGIGSVVAKFFIQIYSYFLDLLLNLWISFAFGCGTDVRIRKLKAPGLACTGSGQILILTVRLLTQLFYFC